MRPPGILADRSVIDRDDPGEVPYEVGLRERGVLWQVDGAGGSNPPGCDHIGEPVDIHRPPGP